MPFQGVFSVLPTPFNDDGSLDLESLKKVVDLYMSAGINGVTALGVTGEVARLNDREGIVVLETVIKQVNGRAALKSAAIRAPGAVMDRTTIEALDRQLRWIKANGGAAWISD